jgi:hypothetical protein
MDPKNDTVADPAEPAMQHPLAARSDRRMVVNVLTAVALVAVAVSVWPTEARKLEKRAAQFVDAANRGDAAGAYQYLAPATRQRITQREWASAVSTRRTRSEILTATVADNGDSGSVTFADTNSKRTTATTWVRVDQVWYYEDALRAKP